jgi:RNA polymerase-binding transcription factor DksA
LDVEHHKQRLLQVEKSLAARLEKVHEETPELADRTMKDWGDLGKVDKVKEEEFLKGEVAWETLREVRDALKRIQKGTYGICIVDGEPIDAMAYCRKHAELGEKPGRYSTATM